VNLHLLPVRSPFDDRSWLCWCGQLHATEAAARCCLHPPARLPVPHLRDRAPQHVEVSAASRRRAAIGGIIALTAWVALLAGLLLWALGTDQPAPGPDPLQRVGVTAPPPGSEGEAP
jgi:hypothetical protein